MKTLEELNLVDDFLVNSLTSHKIYGEESSRYILECILGRKIGNLKVVPQRFVTGENPECHGVRLDVYLDEEDGEIFDIEPDQNSGKEDRESLPRRVRFYHAKIDAGNLAAGEEYSKLRNVIVIFITTYDPFGRDRMVYTIKNGCVEEPDIPYDDGACTLFLYTKGTVGNPPEKLKQLLRYMEESTTENAKSEGLKELHKMVTAVKRDGEVGFAYMKSFEREQRIKAAGKAEGIELGKAQGRIEGKEEGIELGKAQGIELGKTQGIEMGKVQGRIEGKAENLVELVCRKLRKGKSAEVIAEELEEELEVILPICEIASAYAPDYDSHQVYEAFVSGQNTFLA